MTPQGVVHVCSRLQAVKALTLISLAPKSCLWSVQGSTTVVGIINQVRERERETWVVTMIEPKIQRLKVEVEVKVKEKLLYILQNFEKKKNIIGCLLSTDTTQVRINNSIRRLERERERQWVIPTYKILKCRGRKRAIAKVEESHIETKRWQRRRVRVWSVLVLMKWGRKRGSQCHALPALLLCVMWE